MLGKGLILETIHVGSVSFPLLEDMGAVGKAGLWGVFAQTVKGIKL